MASERFNTPKVEAWLGRLGPDTARVYESIFTNFMKWVRENGGEFKDYTPEDFIEFQMEATNSQRYKIVDLLQGYINSIEGRAGYKRKVRSTIRSFFLHNRCELPKDPSFIIRGDIQRVIGTLTLEEFKTLILRCNPAYQAMFLSMFQGGMGLAEVEYWNLNGYSSLMEQLKTDPDIVRIDLPGRKRARFERPYYTLIGSDAINAIRGWLEIRPPDAEAIFTNKFERPINNKTAQGYWRRHLRDLGIMSKKYTDDKSNRYGKNPHELRTLFRSQWEKAPAKVSVAEYLMGHVVDPLDYNQAFKDETWTRKQYELALPMLQIISSGSPFGRVDLDQVKKLKMENEKFRKAIQDMQTEVNDRERKNEDTLAILMDAVRELKAELEQLKRES